MSAPVDTNVPTVGLFVWFHSVLGMAAGAAQWAYLFVWTSIVVRFKAMKVPFRYTFLKLQLRLSRRSASKINDL